MFRIFKHSVLVFVFFSVFCGSALACGGFFEKPCPTISVSHDLNPRGSLNEQTYNPRGIDYGEGYGFLEYNSSAVQDEDRSNVLTTFVNIVRRLVTDEQKTFVLSLEVNKVINNQDTLVGKRIIAAVSFDDSDRIKYSDTFSIMGRLTPFIKLDSELLTIALKVQGSRDTSIDLSLIRQAAGQLSVLAGGTTIGAGAVAVSLYSDSIQQVGNAVLKRFNTTTNLERSLGTPFIGDNIFGVRFDIVDQDLNRSVSVVIKKQLVASVLSSRFRTRTDPVPIISADAMLNLSVAKIGNGVSVYDYLRQPTDSDQGIFFRIGTEADVASFANDCSGLRDSLSRTYSRYDAAALFWSVLNRRSNDIQRNPKYNEFKAAGCISFSDWDYFEQLKFRSPVSGFSKPAS